MDSVQQRAAWERHRRDQLERWGITTPTERVEWLEEMLTVAVQVGALRRERVPDEPDTG
jgi:hypothetical protein